MVNPNDVSELSTDGALRKERMLPDLLVAMRRTHARRRGRRRLAMAAVPAVTLAAAAWLWTVRPKAVAPAPEHVATLAESEAGPALLEPSNPNQPVIVRVTTDPTVLDRLRANVLQPSAVILDDQMLLDDLASIDRPAGLVRSADRVWLTRVVADQVPAMNSPDNPAQPSSRVKDANHAS